MVVVFRKYDVILTISLAFSLRVTKPLDLSRRNYLCVDVSSAEACSGRATFITLHYWSSLKQQLSKMRNSQVAIATISG